MLLLAAATALGAGAAPAASYAAASVRIIPSFATTTTYSYRGTASVDLGMVVAPVGGDFEIHATRSSYDVAPVVTQVNPLDGSVVQTLGPGSLRGWRGLRRFFEITVMTKSGELAALRHLPFCPNATERVDDAAIISSRYPSLCGTQLPFVRGMVWGLEDKLLPWPEAAEGYRRSLHAEWIELDDVGHAPQLDVPLETAQLILGFRAM